MLNPKIEHAKIAGQILSCYKNTTNLVIPIINQIEFEKSITEDNIPFILDTVMKSYIPDMISKLEKEKDRIKKSELNDKIQSELEPLRQVNVVFDRVVKSVWVDIVDTEKKIYKDNSLTKKLNLAGKPA